MRIDYLSKVGAAVSALFVAPSAQLLGPTPHKDLVPTKSVAIIGAGAGGTSTAYFLHQFLASPNVTNYLQHSITVYEQSDKVGGRCAAFRVRNPGQDDIMVEVGASIFVQANKNLVQAAADFGLKVKPTDDELVAIWDGEDFVFEQSQSKLWSILKGLRRWGLSPVKMQRLVKTAVNNLLQSYASQASFESTAEFAAQHDFDQVAAVSSADFLLQNGIGSAYSREIVEVATRVNYGSNLKDIHALGGLVSLAADDALQIEGGNFQIFEGMLARSQAKVRLQTKVARVRKIHGPAGTEPRFEVTASDGHRETFDSIVIAAPMHLTDIDFDLDMDPPPVVNYRTVHATFVRGHVNPAYFHAAPSKSFPAHILTTNNNAEFTSLSIQTTLSTGETITKIFSPEPLSEDLLDRLYSNRTWVKSKAWKAYPEMRPVPASPSSSAPEQDFDPNLGSETRQQVLGSPSDKLDWGQVQLQHGLFYVNAFEPLISTMETETLSGKNIARLIRDQFMGKCPVENPAKS